MNLAQDPTCYPTYELVAEPDICRTVVTNTECNLWHNPINLIKSA